MDHLPHARTLVMMQTFRAVAVDMRGYGESDKLRGKDNYVTHKLVDDIKQLLPALGRFCLFSSAFVCIIVLA